jgi:hypothetical protein
MSMRKQLEKAILRFVENCMKALDRAAQHVADGNAEPAALACTKAKAHIDEAMAMVARAQRLDPKWAAQLATQTRYMERAVWVTTQEVSRISLRDNQSLRFLLQSFIIEGGKAPAMGEIGVGDADASLHN